MAGLFNLPPRATVGGDLNVIKKSKATKKSAGISVKGGGGLLERIATISAMVTRYLGKYESQYEIISDEAGFKQYITDAIEQGFISIDTETTGLDPLQDIIAGTSIFTPGRKAAYCPMNHVSYITGIRVEAQLSNEFVGEQFQRLKDSNTKIIMTNAKFDTRMLKHNCGVSLTAYWDCYIAARMLNENEPENNLKALHKKYCLKGEGDAFTFDSLFKGIKFTQIPVKVGYLYAARDAEITYELYEFQKQYLPEDVSELIAQGRHDLAGVARVFHEIEMPLIPVISKMEDTGVAIDFEFAEALAKEYEAKLEDDFKNIFTIMDGFGVELDKYRKKMGNANKLEYPVNIASPTQVAIMLYDILKITPPDKEKPRGTGEEILEKINHPVAKAIVQYRGTSILLKTFIKKIPAIVDPKTKRVHASFNQMGADTGRFSSSDPNLQNIPSHNKEIRKMFCASKGYAMLSSDYSAQEPRITAHMSRDKKMIQAYLDGKDLYVEIASLAYNKPADECQEFRADGSKNPEGKDRRSAAKAIVLGVCYGKGVAAIADDLNIDKKAAQTIYDKIMKGFPGLKQFMEDSESMAKNLGYVTTIWGRKRRLPKMQLEPYEFTYAAGSGNGSGFDPLSFDYSEEEEDLEVPEKIQKMYIARLNKAYGNASKRKIKDDALEQGILIKDNGGYIAEATRQCVNSRIQGSAADQTKKAMILVGNDKRLEELGFRLLIPVHDELIGECPIENIKEVSAIFSGLMIEAAKELAVPSKCDVEITDRWYGDALQIAQ